MKDRICLVTGANTGLGLETARGLARRGATVVMTARDVDKGRAAVEEVRRTSDNDDVELLELDLASTASVRRAAASFLDRHDALHLLVNNAGLVLSERRTTDDGFEATFGVNHLGHFLLTWLLLDRLKASAPSRVINVASDVHRASRGLDFDDLQRERRRYIGFAAYNDSKLANVLFTRELARRLDDSGVVVHAVHPGAVKSGFARDGDTRGWFKVLVDVGSPFMITPEQGARTTLYVATSDDAGQTTGEYWYKRKRRTPSGPARDAAAARRLWDVSVALLGLSERA
jgi:retinol dehydrogenase 12